jgi:hypothetical protein
VTDASKASIIETLLDGYLKHLRARNSFTETDAKGPPTLLLSLPNVCGLFVTAESPAALMWTLYFAGHHYDHIGNTEQALAIVDEAIKHTPTLVDIYILKARIYKVLSSQPSMLLVDR